MSGNARAPVLKKRNEAAFCAARAEIAQLRSQAAAGHMVLGYLDEAGFSCVHPNRSAWTKVAPDVYVAGVICGGMNTHSLFIENSRVHAVKIIEKIMEKSVSLQLS